MSEDIEKLFVNSKPSKLIIELQTEETEHYIQELCRTIDSTYSHTVKIIQRLEKENLIKSRKDGRKKICELTPKGEKVADNIKALLDSFQEA